MADSGAPDTVRMVSDLRARIAAWRGDGKTIGLVPTMGGLHEGHLALVRRSLALTERTVVTLFVNPTQFGEGEDYDTYPREEAADAALLAAEGMHLLFAPGLAEMVPEGAVTRVSVPGISDDLEGACRPHFLSAVATIVVKLLNQALPDKAFFGEKDYQQLQVVRRMTLDLHIPVAIEPVPTVREADGLALSSRNTYLSEAEQKAAPALYRVITAVAEKVAAGAQVAEQCGLAEQALLDAGFQKVDYVAVRHAETLAPVQPPGPPARVLAAAWLGRARLIDNVAV